MVLDRYSPGPPWNKNGDWFGGKEIEKEGRLGETKGRGGM